jgi:hypothetical protein
MGTSFASSGDLQLRWPSLPSAQAGTAEELLGDASMFLRQWYPDLATQVATDSDLARAAKAVACAMVKRAMLSVTPGVAQESTGTGPYNHSVTYSNPDGNLFVTAGEDAMIRGYKARAVTVSMAPDVC